MLTKKFFLTLILISFTGVIGFCADEEPDIEAIEAEFTKKKEDVKVEVGSKKDVLERSETDSFKEPESDYPDTKLQFSDLSKMIPFSDVSVIQKKFLPKVNRFQFHIGGTYLSNNPFYDTVGLVGRLAFNFTDSIGLELNGMVFNGSPKYITEDLKDVHGILASSIVSATSYYGLDLMLIPFYGKITWLDERIIPYDFFLNLGIGLTNLTDIEDPASTFHVAIGQIYALTKNFVVRWDLSGNIYQAEVPEVTITGTSSDKHVQNFKDVLLGGGISILFPEAGYR
jgi:outer membrane beta-barrel protein